MIQSLLRAMELLELLKEANHKYSIAELSESTGLPPSTIHRILQTFCEKKYVIRDEHAHTYQLGPALISLGRAAADNVRIQDAALPILKNLSYCTREDSYLIIQVGDKGLVLDKTDGPNHLKVVEEFGYEMDLHCGGKNIILFVCGFVGINAVCEMVSSTILTGAVGAALYRAKFVPALEKSRG
mgnify:CR=1 FL=1